MEDIKLWIILAQLINFWIIFFVFYHFLWAKIVSLIEERRNQLKSLNESDDVVKQKIEQAEKEASEIVSQAKSKWLEIQKNAEELVKRETSQKLSEAESKAQALVDWALRDIEKERLSMVNTLKDKLVDVSLRVNSKIFEDSSKNKEFIQKEVSSINL